MFDTFGDVASLASNVVEGDWEGAIADAVNVVADCYTCGQGGDIAGSIVEGVLSGDGASDIAQTALRDYAKQYIGAAVA